MFQAISAVRRDKGRDSDKSPWWAFPTKPLIDTQQALVRPGKTGRKGYTVSYSLREEGVCTADYQ